MIQQAAKTGRISGTGIATVAAGLAATVVTAVLLKPVMPWFGDVTKLAGDDLTWLANLLAVGTGVTTAAGLLRRRMSHLGAINAQLEKENAGRLETISELTIAKESAEKANAALLARLPQTALAHHACETRDGNSERAAAVLRSWLGAEGGDVALILYRLANWTAAHAVGELRPAAYGVARAYAGAVQIFAGRESPVHKDAQEIAEDLALLKAMEGLPDIAFEDAVATLLAHEEKLRIFDADKVLWAKSASREAQRLTMMHKSHLSLPLIERAVQILTREIGADAVPTLEARLQMAIDLRRLGRYEAAFTELDDVVAVQTALAAAGTTRFDPSGARKERATVLRFQGRYDSALRQIDAVIADMQEQGWDEINLLGAKFERACILRWMSRESQALAEADAVIALLLEKGFPRHDNLLIVCRSLRAMALQSMGESQAALAAFDEVIETLDTLNLPFHFELLVAKHGRAGALRGVGRSQDALVAIDEVLALKMANPAMGPAHSETIASRYERAYTLEHLERNAEALAEIDTTMQAISAPEAAAAFRVYLLFFSTRRASVLRKLGRFDEALVDLDGAIAMLSSDPAFGPDHSEMKFAQSERQRILDRVTD
jgi:tetratricopeptide (TPR) repeat protein